MMNARPTHSHLRMLRRLLSLTAALAIPAIAAAQSTGGLTGTVTGKTGPIQNARVAVEVATPIVAYTDASGKYSLRELPAGRHQVLITAIGYKPMRQSVVVVAGQSAAADAKLEQGSILLGSVVTTANRLPMEATQVAATINTLEPEQIRTSPAREAQDLLRELPSVELPRTSSVVSGNAQIVSMRGVDEGRTVVLFDGVPITDAWGEWVDWSRVPNGMLDRVEVIGGGTSALYGNGAIGGMIQYFSRPMAPGAVSAQVDMGSRDSRHLYYGAGLPISGAWSANVNFDYSDGGGYRLIDSTGPGCPVATPTTAKPDSVVGCVVGKLDNESLSIRRNAYARLYYNPTGSKLSGYVTGHTFADNRNLGTPLAKSRRDEANLDLALNYGEYPTGQFALRAFNGHQFERTRTTGIRSTATSTNATGSCPQGIVRVCEDTSANSVIPSHDWGASVQWTRTNWMHLQSFSTGADYRHMQGAFDETDYNTSCPGANCGKFLRAIWSGGAQALSGAYASAIAEPLASLQTELSARIDHWDNVEALSVDSALASTKQNIVSYPSRHQTTFNPRVGLRYQLFSNMAVHGAAYMAFRAPNLAELYRKQINAGATQITLPNPSLLPERGLGREIGLTYSPVHWVEMKGTYSQAEYKDFNSPFTFAPPVAPDTSPCGATFAGTCRQRKNIGGSRSEGIEGVIAIRPIQAVLLSASVNYDDVRQQTNLGPTVTDSTKPRVNRVPSPKQVVKAVYTDRMFGTWTGIWRHEGHTTTLQGAVLDPYTVVDVHVRRDVVRGVLGFLAVENVGNTRYQVNLAGTGAAALVSYGMPRTLRAGLTLTRD
jgi:outer membrane receptor protein involved in Fe transport